MDKKILPNTPRMTYQQVNLACQGSLRKVEACCIKHEGSWVLIFCIESEQGKFDVLLSSQRKDIRKFKTIEAARNACDFLYSMTVIGK